MNAVKLDNNNNKENVPECKVCKNPSKDRCSRCKKARYCSRECQVSDWPTHKQMCASNKTLTSKYAEIFKCKLCSQLLVDPVTLPCCASLVCASHVDVLENTNYTCHICHQCHRARFTLDTSEIDEALFHIEEQRSDVFEQLSELDPKEFVRIAKETISKTEKGPKTPKLAVLEYFEDIKNQVDVIREEFRVVLVKETDDEALLEKIDDQSNFIIECLCDLQEHAVKKAEALEPSFNETVLEDLKAMVHQVESKSIDDGQFEQVNKQILEFKFRCDQMLSFEDHWSCLKDIHIGILSLFDCKYCDIVNTLVEHKIKPIKYILKITARNRKELKNRILAYEGNCVWILHIKCLIFR